MDHDAVFGDHAVFWGAKPGAQMEMRTSASRAYLKDSSREPESLKKGAAWAQNVHQRPAQQGAQLPLPFHANEAGVVPTDPNLHRLRQQNPALNDYQFKFHHNADRGGSISAFHPAQGHVGELAWGGGQEFDHFEGKPRVNTSEHHEIEMVNVAGPHTGKGIAEGMYDYASSRGISLMHSHDRSEEGEAFARRVGGPTLPRTAGMSREFY